MRTDSTRRWALVVGFVVVLGPGAGARAGFFLNAFAGSPLAFYGPAPGYDGGAAYSLASSTYYTDGTNVFSSSGYSSVDLTTGTLHAAASADFGYIPDAIASILVPNPGDTPLSDQFGNSSFGDALTFLGNFTGQTVTFHISVDGTWTGSSPFFNASDFQFMVLPAGTIDANSDNTLNIFNNPGNVATFNRTDSIDVTPTFSLSYDVPVTLNGLNPTLEFAANLNINPFATVGDSFSADFSDTAGISFTAPGGVTVISASGVFPGTVPEPGSMALSLVGLAVAGLFARTRSRRGRAGAAA